MRLHTQIMLAAALMIGHIVSASSAERSCPSLFAVCTLERLSWVSAYYWGDPPTADSAPSETLLEEDIRAYARRELSTLSQEVQAPNSDETRRLSDPRLAQKGLLRCGLGTATAGSHTAVSVECELHRFDRYLNNKTPLSSSRAVAIFYTNRLDKEIRDLVRTLIRAIGDDYYKQRSKIERTIAD